MAPTLVGAGVYDASEVSRLLAAHVERVIRWATPGPRGTQPIVTPSLGKMFTFHDLVSLAVIGELARRNVSEDDIRRGVEYLQERTGYDQPLTHRSVVDGLATSGRAWLADLDGDGWYDIGKGGQGAFREIIKLYLQRLSYDDLGVADRWRPVDGVLIDPAIQAGTPCIEGTRVPTETVAELALSSPIEAVADDFDLTVDQVRHAVDFEAGLSAGRGIAA